MKAYKLIHLLALLALVACVPIAGPSQFPPTTTPTSAVIATTAAPPTVTSASASATPTAPMPTTAQQTAAAAPSPTPAPTDTATTGGPQWGHPTKTSGCVARGPLQDPDCTPGDVFPVTAAQVCVSGYSASVRDVPTSEKDAVYAEYGVTSHSTGQYEVDHLVSLELGGSNEISNLWPEAASPTPGFHQKDVVENYLHAQVCKGAMTLAAAQQLIAADWLAAYSGIPPTLEPLPTPTNAPEPTIAPRATQAEQGQPTEAPTIAPADTPTQEVAPTATPTAGGGDGARVRKGALCNDGTSSSATGSGACSKHGGVKCWNYSDGTCTKP